MKRKSCRLYINGTWVEGAETVEVRSPYDGASVGKHHRAGREQCEAALAGAEAAFRANRDRPAYERAGWLAAMARVVERRAEEFAQTILGEAGKPLRFARTEVERSLHTLTWSSEEAKRIDGQFLPLDVAPVGRGHVGLTRRFPAGPALAITPFNFPLNLVCHKVGPALASGCSIVLRPASQTPLTALLLAEAAEEAGVPPGLLNVVPCSVPLAEAMIDDPRVRVVTFTGSPLVGWPMKARAAQKKVVLELGGNAAVLFDHDYDYVRVIPKIASSAYGYAGQSCISIQRIYVHRDLEEKFVRDFCAYVRESVPFGDPRDEATVVGPLIRSEEADRVMSWIAEAREHGAEVLCGGHREHSVIAPTLMRHVDPSMRVSCQEVFGPVAVLDTYGDLDEGLRKINDSRFGLQAGVFTHDIDRAFRAFRDLEVGGLTVNETPTWRIDHMPYGGVKESGFGREGIRYAIEEMTELKLLVLNLES